MREANQDRIKLLVLFHSEHGHTYQLALQLAEGISRCSNATAVLKRIPLIAGAPASEPIAVLPEARMEELPEYAGIAFGCPVHFGNMSADMRHFLDQSVSLWTSRKLQGIPSTVFMAAGSGAGIEAAILSFWNTLAIHGMLLLPTGLMGTEQTDTLSPQGHTPFGAGTQAAAYGERPSASEKLIANKQGYALAKLAAAIHQYAKEIS